MSHFSTASFSFTFTFTPIFPYLHIIDIDFSGVDAGYFTPDVFFFDYDYDYDLDFNFRSFCSFILKIFTIFKTGISHTRNFSNLCHRY